MSDSAETLFMTGRPKGYPCLVATRRCVTLYAAGASLETLAGIAATSINNVRHALLRAGVTMRKAGRPRGTRNPDDGANRKITLAQETEIVKSRMEGHSARALAAFYGITKTRVHQILRAYGCTTTVHVTTTRP